MFKMKMLMVFCIAILLAFVLVSCKSVGNADSKASNESEPSLSNESSITEISHAAREHAQWGFINQLAMNLNKTAIDIVEETIYQVDYNWFDDKTERLTLHDGGLDIQCLLFSNSAWDTDSHCTGVYAMSVISMTMPEEAGQMKELFGEATAWREGENGESAYYQYLFDDNVEVRFYTNGDGTLLDKNMLVKLADTESMNGRVDYSEGETDLLSPSIRSSAEWQNLNHFFSYVGKTLGSIMLDYPDLEYMPDVFMYEDGNSGARFYFSDDVCNSIYIPVILIFPDITGEQLTREYLTDYYKTNYTWLMGESCAYVFEFEDATIYMDSNIDGSLPYDGFIKIQSLKISN